MIYDTSKFDELLWRSIIGHESQTVGRSLPFGLLIYILPLNMAVPAPDTLAARATFHPQNETLAVFLLAERLLTVT